MICAYDKIYLENCRRNFALMLDYAVNDLHYNLDDFFEMFLLSGIDRQIECGNPTYLVGKSGIELAKDIIFKVESKEIKNKAVCKIGKSREYWTGWAIAYFQWYSSIKFKDIVQSVPINKIIELYSPYHEMDIRHFCDKLISLIKQKNTKTNLSIYRKKSNLTQLELSKLTDIPLRTIQQYEQKQKNINNAKAEYLVKLSKILCCSVEDLIEKI